MAEDWEKYEGQIFAKFRAEVPECEVVKNHKVRGRFSEELRQVDVYVSGSLGDTPIAIAVECKHFSRKVDVKCIESMIGMLDDLGVDKGVLITTQGFTKGAVRRAKYAKIRLDIVAFEDWEDYDPVDEELCEICEPDEDSSPGWVLTSEGNKVKRGNRELRWSCCSRCNGINVYCPRCGCLTGVDEGAYGDRTECNGGCGMIFIADIEYDSDAIGSETVEICRKR